MQRQKSFISYRKHARRFATALPMALALADAPAQAETIFVDANANGNNSGTSWQNAFNDLQEALDAGLDGDEVWVACATYLPTTQTDPLDMRSATFSIGTGLSIYGGFVGVEDERTQRDADPSSNGCVLGEAPPEAGAFEGYYHIVRVDDATAPVTIDGFTITGGRATSTSNEQDDEGGCLRAQTSELNLRNMVFDDCRTVTNGPGFGGAIMLRSTELDFRDGLIRNSFSGRGGGIALDSGAALSMQRISISDSLGGFGGGGAIFARASGKVSISDSVFENNRGNNSAGAINFESNNRLQISRSIFRGNSSVNGLGGAIHLDHFGTSLIDNSVFVGNAARDGGAIEVNSPSQTVISNSTFAHNQASVSGAGILVDNNAEAIIQNSILHGNFLLGNPDVLAAQALAEPDSTALLSIEFSLVEGGFPGTGNIDANPGFVAAPSAGDDDDWLSTADNDFGNVRLLPSSVAIDAGNNEALLNVYEAGSEVASDLPLDADRHARLLDEPGVSDTGQGSAPIIDMGAFEFTRLVFADSFEAVAAR